MGGPTLSSDRFFDELKAIKIKYGGEVYDVPQVICFTEFKPNEEDMLVKLYEKNVHEVFEGKFGLSRNLQLREEGEFVSWWPTRLPRTSRRSPPSCRTGCTI